MGHFPLHAEYISGVLWTDEDTDDVDQHWQILLV